MSKGNKRARSSLLETLLDIRALLDEAIEEAGGETAQAPQRERELRAKAPPTATRPISIDLHKPMRAFIKNYAKGMSGPEKFVLLLARIAQGDQKTEVSLPDIEAQWRRMKGKSLLGMNFNRFYAARARENDWVDTTKKASYHLRPSWKDIFN